jgi:hypothetical protein
MILLILKNIQFAFCLIFIYLSNYAIDFPEDLKKSYDKIYRLRKKRVFNFILYIITIMECMLLYFIKLFSNYGLLISGRKKLN